MNITTLAKKIDRFMDHYFPYERSGESLTDIAQFTVESPYYQKAWFTSVLNQFDPTDKGYQDCTEIINLLTEVENNYRCKKSYKMAALRQPHNYWINRRVWLDDMGNEYVKINGNYIGLVWLISHNWDVEIYF